ncbi:MAG: ABC transporter permease [Planctomycetota bacterium]
MRIEEAIIRPSHGAMRIDWQELWRFRELGLFLAWRDISVRYKQTVLGAAWAILQPVMSMIVFSVLFGRLGGMDQRTSVPYPIYVFAGLLPWTFFANAVSASGGSLVGSATLISRVYFPRILVPLAAVGGGLVDFAIAFVVMLLMMVGYSIGGHSFPVGWQVLTLPVFVLGAVVAATGVGMLISALNVSYRDFRYVIPFMIQIWLFLSPVIYPPTLVPAEWRPLLALNPMTGMIGGFRAAVLGTTLDWHSVAVGFAVAAVAFVVGAIAFQRMERRFADVI